MKAIRTNVMILEEASVEKKSEGGILLPTEKIDFSKPVKATIISVGSEVKDVEVGDVVYYPPKTGYAITVEDKTYRIFDEKDIIAVV